MKKPQRNQRRRKYPELEEAQNELVELEKEGENKMGEEPMIATERRHHLHIGLELTSAIVKMILTLNDIIKKLLTARTIFTMIFFSTLCYMLLKEKEIPQILSNTCTALLAFYFGQKSQMEVMKNDKTSS